MKRMYYVTLVRFIKSNKFLSENALEKDYKPDNYLLLCGFSLNSSSIVKVYK